MPHVATRRALSLAALLLATAAAHAQPLYKWVDEKGVTQYTQTPPPEGTKGAAKMELKVTPQAPGATDDWKAKELVSRQKKAQEDIAGEKSARQEASQRRQRCHHAADRLELYRTQVPVYRLNDRGEKVYMEDSERPAAIARAQGEVEKYCDR
jgi:hypothetical protein